MNDCGADRPRKLALTPCGPLSRLAPGPKQLFKHNSTSMKHSSYSKFIAGFAAVLATSVLAFQLHAADDKDALEKFMKEYHKAPKGTDPVCKKAVDGKASPEEIKKLIEGYKMMTTIKPPKGDEASWKEKTGKVYAAAQGLVKGGAEAQAKYKEAVNCKACHSLHKPD